MGDNNSTFSAALKLEQAQYMVEDIDPSHCIALIDETKKECNYLISMLTSFLATGQHISLINLTSCNNSLDVMKTHMEELLDFLEAADDDSFVASENSDLENGNNHSSDPEYIPEDEIEELNK